MEPARSFLLVLCLAGCHEQQFRRLELPSECGAQHSCLAKALLDDLGRDHLLAGGLLKGDRRAPFDLEYVYITGGVAGTTPCKSCDVSCRADWWGCWQDPARPPGQYVRDTIAGVSDRGRVPMFTYFNLLSTAAVAEGPPEIKAVADRNVMTRYWNDLRFFLQSLGEATAIVHIEPDFWGFAQREAASPSFITAAVAQANVRDCALLPNTVAGMGQCIISMGRQYAPNARLGLHASMWASGRDISRNSDPTYDVEADAQRVAQFLAACGASAADFIGTEASDRDAGYYASVGQNRFWDAKNAELPNFAQALTWTRALAEALGVPTLWWQVPLGHMGLPNKPTQWHDNRVAYFYTHLHEVAEAHGIGVAFGPGRADQTSAATDQEHLVRQQKAYVGRDRLAP